jgi:hypothetical protein
MQKIVERVFIYYYIIAIKWGESTHFPGRTNLNNTAPSIGTIAGWGLELTRIIQSLYYAPAGRYINAWMHSLKKSVEPEIVNRYDLWVLRHKIGGANVFVNNVQWRFKPSSSDSADRGRSIIRVRALPVYWLHPVYYNWQLMHDKQF